MFNLLGKNSIAPATVSYNSNAPNTFKNKRQNSFEGKWVWSPFTNSSRGDSLQLNHWVKAQDAATVPDYVYSKFNTKIEGVTYSDEEYTQLLTNSQWTRSETDVLMKMCYQFDLRWPVIVDRCPITPHRPCEDLMARSVPALPSFVQ